MNFVIYCGNTVFSLISYIGSLATLLGKTLYWCFIPPFKANRILTQAKRVGPGSLFISSLVAFFIGMIMALHMAYQLKEISAEIYIPNIVAYSLTRELVPVLTALIVAGRIGAGITAEIGSMKVTEQIDALKAFAVDPIKYLVVPRFLALVLMLPLLTVFADLVGILGAFVICIYKFDISPALYFTNVAYALEPNDILSGLVKTVFFGAIIALIGCHHGLRVTGGAEGVGRETTASVVRAFILIIISDGIFTTLFYYVFKI